MKKTAVDHNAVDKGLKRNARIVNHQLYYVEFKEMEKKRDLSELEWGAGSVRASIGKTAELVMCSREAVVNAYKKFITKQNNASQRQACDRHKLLKVRLDKRIAKVV
ncbi:hypothetical protein TNCV_4407591 [Trichonephila clavipes]|nr:hypothetical protein TNCV_4407591 [Trichonephila clavipes]